jgi:hypothetical protein
VQKTCGVCFDGAYATKKLVPRLYCTSRYCSTVVTRGVDLYAPCRHLIELTVGVPLFGGGGRRLYEQKLLKYRTLVAENAIWAQLLRRQVAYGYMGCSAMCHLGTIFLVAYAPSKQRPHFFTQYAETGFLRFTS